MAGMTSVTNAKSIYRTASNGEETWNDQGGFDKVDQIRLTQKGK
jgi:hypothetical protein